MSSNEKEQEPILWWHPPVLLSFLPLQIQRPDWILVMLLYKHFETNCETLDLYPPAHRHTQFLLVWYRTNHQEHHLTMFQIHKKKDTNYFLVQKLRTWNSFKKAQIYIPFTLILIQRLQAYFYMNIKYLRSPKIPWRLSFFWFAIFILENIVLRGEVGESESELEWSNDALLLILNKKRLV